MLVGHVRLYPVLLLNESATSTTNTPHLAYFQISGSFYLFIYLEGRLTERDLVSAGLLAT